MSIKVYSQKQAKRGTLVNGHHHKTGSTLN